MRVVYKGLPALDYMFNHEFDIIKILDRIFLYNYRHKKDLK